MLPKFLMIFFILFSKFNLLRPQTKPESHTKCWLLVTIYNRDTPFPPAPPPAPPAPPERFFCLILEKKDIMFENFLI